MGINVKMNEYRVSIQRHIIETQYYIVSADNEHHAIEKALTGTDAMSDGSDTRFEPTEFSVKVIYKKDTP